MTLRNAFGDLATEATLGLLAGRTNSAGDAVLVSGSKIKWRREFNDASLQEFTVVTGSGQSVTAGSGALVITSGTTVNAESIVTSKQAFSAPFRAQFGVLLSSKIANHEVYVEIVAENADGSIDETRVAAWRIAGSDSVTTTVARTEVRNGGAARLQSANISSQASQIVASVYEIVLESDEVRFYSKVADGGTARSLGAVRHTTAPDPNVKYRLRYRVKNGATAPASSITFTSAFATCVDYTEIQTEVTGGNGAINGDQAIPVYSTGGSVSVTTTALGANATVTGTLIAKVLSAATTNATNVKASAARLYGWQLGNTSSGWRYFRLYNTTTAPTVGTTVPVMVIPIPPGMSVQVHHAAPISFGTGLSYAITGAAPDLDSTVVAANDVVGHLIYL